MNNRKSLKFPHCVFLAQISNNLGKAFLRYFKSMVASTISSLGDEGGSNGLLFLLLLLLYSMEVLTRQLKKFMKQALTPWESAKNVWEAKEAVVQLWSRSWIRRFCSEKWRHHGLKFEQEVALCSPHLHTVVKHMSWSMMWGAISYF